MKRFNYAAPGMLEWSVLIPLGHNVLRVNFTDGSLSGYGTRPATFSTDNEYVARLIEGSPHYRNGRIIKLRGPWK